MFFLDTSLGDSTSQFIITILITIIIGYIGIHISLKQQMRKRLTRQIVSRSPIINYNTLDPDLQLHLKNRTINNGYYVTLRITNSGNTSISKEDFDNKPYVISFGPTTEVVKAEIKESSLLHTLTADEFHIEEKSVSLGPLMLNQSDYIQFKVTLNNYPSKAKIQDTVHIKDCKIITLDDSGKGTFTQRISFYRGAAMALCLLVCLLIIIILQFFQSMSSIVVFSLVIILTIVTVIFLATVFTSLLTIIYS